MINLKNVWTYVQNRKEVKAKTDFGVVGDSLGLLSLITLVCKVLDNFSIFFFLFSISFYLSVIFHLLYIYKPCFNSKPKETKWSYPSKSSHSKWDNASSLLSSVWLVMINYLIVYLLVNHRVLFEKGIAIFLKWLFVIISMWVKLNCVDVIFWCCRLLVTSKP